ncbi:Uncharacterised protein [Vibrio cholerae]|nr:Uncharacterised protein [Vibrio cholerae]
MGFPGRAVSHTNLAMTLLHQVIEFIEAQLRAGQSIAINQVGLLAIHDNTADLTHQLIEISIFSQARDMRMFRNALVSLL